MPRKKVQFEVLNIQRTSAQLPCLRCLNDVIEVSVRSHCGRFHEAERSSMDRRERSRLDFLRLLRFFGTYRTVLRHVQKLTSPGSRTHHHFDHAPVPQLHHTVTGQRLHRHPVPQLLRQMLIRMHHLCIENIRCLVFGLRNDHRRKVRLEQHHIKPDQIDQRGEAQLTRLQHHVVIPERIEERLLRRSHLELNILPVFVYYMI